MLGYLRNQIALSNPEITKLAEKTKSQAIRNAVIEKIYSAVKGQYPGLAQETEEARMRALGKVNGSKATVQPVGNGSQAEAPVSEDRLPEAWKESAEVAAVREQATQVANLILACLSEVNEYVVPQAQAAGITIDAQQAAALTMNMLICLQNGAKAHWKMPTERLSR